jgi:hypothetical protein
MAEQSLEDICTSDPILNELVPVVGGKRELSRFLLWVRGSRPNVSRELVRRDRNRSSKYDVDFELFSPLLDGEDDDDGPPIPRRANGQPFDESNCFCQLVNRPRR